MSRKYVERTKSGLPAMWEAGGGASNTGDATIVARGDGRKKTAVYIRRRGNLAGDRHALIAVEVGDLVVDAYHHRGDFEVTVGRIVAIGDDEAEVEPMYIFSRGEWDNSPPENIMRAVEAARQKASCYHCREPHYVV